MDTNTAVSWDDLPAVITTYLPAHEARDIAAALAAFTADAVVTDEGRTYRGHDEIRAWLAATGSEYTYTTAFTGAARTAAAEFDVVQHLEGDFPGGSADLHYRFALAGDAISRLVIEP
ncbi:nuclear transport factor 2 family protein [Actinoplanes sp. DH11]|uniref:nuclear transport factor 2 family protein n=1 Tax=Actinoplanes sp. DH11 TaxID=2857011 RepID=UPI001E52A841|nr:nuclear transport factor 2 family protein [Actinoplanes sp. DH11]